MAEQRLVQLEAYAAKLAEKKHNLRANFEKVQQEVSDVMMTETTMIRNREDQLKKELMGVYTQKEESIVKQQEDVYKEIGACRQAVSTKQYPPLSLINAAMNDVDEDFKLEFEADIEGSRAHIASLGEIKHKTNQNLSKIGSCLATFSENYDDDNMWLMYNKPYQIKSSTPDTPHEVEKVKTWLHRLPEDSDVLNFDVSKYAADKDDSETTSSFEIITDSLKPKQFFEQQQHQRAPISEKLIASLERPMKEWLIEVARASTTTSLPEHYKFGDIIRNLHNSDDKQWIQESSQKETEPSFSKTDDEMEQVEQEKNETAIFDEVAYIENLTRMFGKTLKSMTDNTVGTDDIDAWRSLIYSMQKSRNWLHQ